MKYKIVKLSKLSGDEASIYSIYLPDHNKTLFDIFVEENKISFKSELKSIFQRLRIIGHETGAREQYFKLYEGEPGDGVCALYDTPNRSLRLYCIRYGSLLIIVGGGGIKQSKTLQEDEKLKHENHLLRQIVKDIKSKMELGEIEFTDDGTGFFGNLKFTDNEED